MSSPESQPYHVSFAGLTRQDLKQIATHLDAPEARQIFRHCWQIIENRLSTDPFQFGEPCYRLLGGDLIFCIGVVKPVAVHFGIHEKTRSVMISRAFLLGS